MANYHNNNGPFTVKQIAEMIGCKFVGNGDLKITSINAIQDATSQQLSVLNNSKYAKYLPVTNAGVVILSEDLLEHLKHPVVLITSDGDRDVPSSYNTKLVNKILILLI